jgi:GNAT superfamily N-acetyltransferase
LVEVVICLIAPHEARLISAAYALYSNSITRSAQRPEAEFRGLVSRKDYRFVAAVLKDELLGVAVIWMPADSDIFLFEYVVVAPKARGYRIGSNLFTGSRILAGEHRTVLIEVEVDLGVEGQAKRLNFFRQLGCQRVVGLDYRMPLRALGIPPPMWLLTLQPQNADSVPTDTVETWLRRIYSEAYDKPFDDPRLAQMIDPLPDADVMLETLRA